jgi:glycine cleavage system H protein
VYVELPDEGDVLERGDIFGTVESVKAANDVYVPLGGEIVAVNRDLEETPELVNKDPYGDGWMIRIAPSNAAEFDDLMAPDDYQAMVAEEEG